MERLYTLWDTEEAYPMYTYQQESAALANVAAVQSHGEDAVVTCGLFRATPDGESRETIAIGHDLAKLPMRGHRAYAASDS